MVQDGSKLFKILSLTLKIDLNLTTEFDMVYDFAVVFLKFLINQVLIPSSNWFKSVKNAFKFKVSPRFQLFSLFKLSDVCWLRRNMTEIIRVAERCARKKLKHVQKGQMCWKLADCVETCWQFRVSGSIWKKKTDSDSKLSIYSLFKNKVDLVWNGLVRRSG